jgi:hypothetical protein
VEGLSSKPIELGPAGAQGAVDLEGHGSGNPIWSLDVGGLRVAIPVEHSSGSIGLWGGDLLCHLFF